jgi:hypothetical protein
MNEAVADHGPTAPWYSARARQVWRFSKSSAAVTVNDGLATNPESWTTTPASFST